MTIIARIAIAALLVSGLGTVVAQDAKTLELELAQQPLSDSLRQVADDFDLKIAFYSESTEGLEAPLLVGTYTSTEALDTLLADTNLEYTYVNESSVAVRPIAVAAKDSEPGKYQPASSQVLMAQNQTSATQNQTGPRETINDDDETSGNLEEILVVGTRIRGIAADSSPTMVFDSIYIENSGFLTTDQLMRSIPQVFGGGASPTQGRSPGAESGSNSVLGASLSLRGLGGGATLVLLNGRRLSSAGSDGQFIDISAIPLSAIERVEVLTDGASAIYGADAVAGVVNIILKDDLDGFEVGINYGVITEGDLDQKRANLAIGDNWASGSGFFSYEYFDRDPLLASEKEFAMGAPNPFYLQPSQQRHSVTGAITQSISEALDFGIHGYYSQADSQGIFNDGNDGTPYFESFIDSDQILIAPSLDYHTSNDWRLQLSADYSETNGAVNSINSVDSSVAIQENNSSTTSADFVADGVMLGLPGGKLRGAFGAHFRNEDFQTESSDGTTKADRDVSSIFGELFIPIVGEDNASPGLERLELSVSARYDDFSDFGDTVNPKVGVLWSPTRDFKLRGSYGTSFNPPALGNVGNRTNQVVIANLADPTSPTGGRLALLATPAGTVPDLDAEESTTFTAGVDYSHDFSSSGLSISATYYDIEFTDRVGSVPFPPGAAVPGLLAARDQLPDEIVIDNPTDDIVQALIDSANATAGVIDVSAFLFVPGPAFSGPSDIEVLLDLRTRNIASIETSGIDFQARYEIGTDNGSFTATLMGNYIFEFDQQSAITTPVIDTANTIFNPADLRLRGSIGWRNQGWNVSTFLNHTTDYEDTRTDPSIPIDSYTTVDLNIGYRWESNAQDSFLEGTRISLSFINLLDEKPPSVEGDAGGSAFSPAFYDPANADPLGRFVSLNVIKRW